MKLTRREFTRLSALGAGALMVPWDVRRLWAQIPGGTLVPGDVDKYTLPLVKPPAMPTAARGRGRRGADMYNIAVRQFQQRILSPPHPMTTVWSYGS
ncbi:MAG: bilirubin oxidase, partial [Planctomycetota bacterium]